MQQAFLFGQACGCRALHGTLNIGINLELRKSELRKTRDELHMPRAGSAMPCHSLAKLLWRWMLQ